MIALAPLTKYISYLLIINIPSMFVQLLSYTVLIPLEWGGYYSYPNTVHKEYFTQWYNPQ